MNVKRWWIGIAAGGGLLTAGLGALIYLEQESLERAQEEVAETKVKIDSHRRLIQGTPGLEREVIVLREMSEVIKGILPDDEDIYNLSRTFQAFSDEAGPRIRGLRQTQNRARNAAAAKQTAFDEVAYTITMEADAFQFLDFLDRLEGHERFMRVPKFRIGSAPRAQVEKDGHAAHRITVDVETFVYDPKTIAKPVAIDGYERKRDLLVGEINRRRQALLVKEYSYVGGRGRRDPWVDPRVPISEDGASGLTVQEQMDRVQALADHSQAMLAQWHEMRQARNVVEEMMARSDLEEAIAQIEEEVRRLQAENAIRYVPSQRRMQLDVIDVVAHVREQLTTVEGGRGPSEAKLRQILEAMNNHFDREEYALMLDAYRLVSGQLDYVQSDPLRQPFVVELKRLARIAQTVREFEDYDLRVSGVAIRQGSPSVVIINGNTLSEGELLGKELLVHEISKDEVQFVFRGVILARRF